ncbi:MAG: GNAT family N-acetyltransferase [Candidatus Aminicenantes bacterium]|nr:GNAT family N-acetyltransferase [Candidatus Aminicenantes bacterium]
MEICHVDTIVGIHLAAFPGFFLSFLGRRFLRELYKAFATDKTSISLVAEAPVSGELMGFAAGTLDPARFFRSLLVRRWWAFGFSSLPAIVRNPRSALRIFRGVSYRGNQPEGRKRALLSSIAVIPGQRDHGLGNDLLKRWVERARAKGAEGCYLTTDAENNDAVNRFYARNGWRVESEFITPEGRKMYRYTLD